MANVPAPQYTAGTSQQADNPGQNALYGNTKVSYKSDGHGGWVVADPSQVDQYAVPQYGGNAQGANAFADYTQGLGAQAASRAAPVVSNFDPTAAADRSSVLSGLGALGTSAAGGGVAQQGAQAGFDVSQNASTQAALRALGNQRGGGAAGAAAAGAGIGASAAGGAQNALASGGALATAAGNAAGQYNSGIAGLANTDWNAATAQANAQEQQNALNQAGQLGFLGLGQSAEEQQLAANAASYGADVGNTTAANALSAQETQANIGLGLGALTGAGQIAAAYGKNNPTAPGGGSPTVIGQNPYDITEMGGE